jgi:predicted adenylyl cyclase CyaB
MLRNIEIKARSRKPARQRDIAARLSDLPARSTEQTDTYFNVPRGRLKLRESAESSQLIYYERRDQAGPKRSEYLPVPVHDPASLRRLLAAAFGIRGVVRKSRRLFQVGHTRIHLDEVLDLGSFIELEVVLSPEEPDEQGRAVAADLMKQLEIDPQDLIDGSYIDLLTQT